MGKKKAKKGGPQLDSGCKTNIPPPPQPPIQLPQQTANNPILETLLAKKIQSLGIDIPLSMGNESTEQPTIQGRTISREKNTPPPRGNLPRSENYDPTLDSLLTKKLESLGIDTPLGLVNNSTTNQTTGLGSIFSCEKLDEDEYRNNYEDEDEVMYSVQQREIFQPYACHVCKAFRCDDGTPLKRCNSCKMISYCSRDHQKSHWPKHKDLCRAMCRVCKRDGLVHLYENALGLSADEYRQYRMRRISECTGDLGREVELWEREMFYHVPACQTCHQSDKSKLTTCDKCLHVNCCTPRHLNKYHDKWCSSFSLYRDIVVYQAEYGMIQPWLPNKVFAEFEPVSGSMREFLLRAFSSAACMNWNKLTYAVATDIATCPLTILYALQYLKPSLDSRRTLTVHMVGAELHFEADTINKYEIFLLHLLPNLKTLRIVFVGPELHDRPPHLLNRDKVCFSCRHAGKQLTTEFHSRTFYHDYVKLPSYARPDLVCAFNAGLYRSTGYAGSDTWPASIRVMLRDPTVPVAVTAYTAQELPLDVERMRQHCPAKLELVLEPTENPFSSSKPSLSFIDEEETPVIFKNFFIAIAKYSE